MLNNKLIDYILKKINKDKYLLDNTMQSPHTSLLCRTVRIGSYKYIPRDRVLISQNGVRFGVPLLEDGIYFTNYYIIFII